MKQGFKISVPMTGCVMMLAVTSALAALVAALFGGGVLPVSTMGTAAWIITFLGCLLGGMRVAGKADSMVLPGGLLAVGMYLLLVFILRGILYQSVGDKAYIVVLAAVLGTLAGVLLSAGKGKPRRKKF